MFRSPSSASLSIEVLHGFSAGSNSPRMFEFPTSNPFKAVLPMSDENKTDNPYQPPTLSDEPLAKQDADGPKAKPHPFHWWVAWLGYGYVPLVIGLWFISEDLFMLIISTVALLALLPVYGLVIFGLTIQRTLQKTNSAGLTLFQILSVVLPFLWLLFLADSWVGERIYSWFRYGADPFSQTTRPYASTPPPCQTVGRYLQQAVRTTKSAVQIGTLETQVLAPISLDSEIEFDILN